MTDSVLENLANTRNFCDARASFALYSCEMSIHQRIRQKRIERGYASQEAFAKEIGVVWQTVQQWEKEGGTAPNRNRIKQVAEVLGTTPEWLMSGAGEDSGPSVLDGPGRRGAPALQWVTEDEAVLLSAYRAKTESGKHSLRVMLDALPDADLSGIDHKGK